MKPNIDSTTPPTRRPLARLLVLILAVFLPIASLCAQEPTAEPLHAGLAPPDDSPHPEMAPALFEPWQPPGPLPTSPHTGYLMPPLDLSHLPGQPASEIVAARSLPATFDWRNKDGESYVTPVRDQGECGACYAFGFLGQLEAKMLIAGSGAFDLSEDHAKECNWKARAQFEFPSGYPWGSCAGGNSFMLASLYSQEGTVLEKCDPYQDQDAECGGSCPYQQTVMDWRLISAGVVPAPDVLKAYLYDHGPLTVSMFVDQGRGFDMSYDGSFTFDYTISGVQANHSVLLVGWSDRLPPVPGESQPAAGWIVKNSWGAAWGDDGYFYVTYGAANLGVMASFVKDWQDHNSVGDLWYYDDDGWWQSWGCQSKTAWALARFIPPVDATIGRVELWTTDITTDVDIYLYDDFDGQEASDLLARQLDLSFSEAGYHSVALDEPVKVQKQDEIAVVVKITNTDYEYPLGADPNGRVEEGRTYLSCTGQSWQDMGLAYDTDIAIRVRTEQRAAAAASAPRVTGITPHQAQAGSVVQISNLAGANFQPAAAVTLSQAGQPDILAAKVNVVSTAQISCELDLGGAAPGTWDVVVTNPDGYKASLANGFTIHAAPQIRAITPDTGSNDGIVQITDLAGENFQPGATVRLARPGQPDIQASTVQVANPRQIVCDFDLRGATTGAWDVVVTNPDGRSGTLPAGYTVLEAPGPVVSDITPSQASNEKPVQITHLSGAHFRPGAQVKLVRAGESDIAASNVTVIDESQLACEFDIAGAAPGRWDVVVTNPNGKSGALRESLAISLGPPPAVFSIAPSQASTGHMAAITDLIGAYFRPGVAVKLVKPGQPDILATSVSVVSGSRLTCNLDLRGAAAGPWDVVVTTAHGQTGILAGGFLVSAPTKVWNGHAGRDWHTADNWTPGGVPGPGDTVTIPDTSHDPVITVADVAIQDLSLEPGAVLDLTLRDLTVEGVLTNDGTLTQSRAVEGGQMTRFLHITNLAGDETKYYGLDFEAGDWTSAEALELTRDHMLAQAPPLAGPNDQVASAQGKLALIPVADAYVLQGYPDRNYGASAEMWTGYDEYLDPDGRIARSLLRFDLSQLAARQPIARAVLRAYLLVSWDFADATRTVAVHRVTSPWSEDTVTWENMPSFVEAHGSQSLRHMAWAWYDFDLTELVRDWYNGTRENHGIMLRGPEVAGQESSWRAFGSKESPYQPHLVIEISSDNTPPILAPLPDQTLPVNGWIAEAIDLWEYASDAQALDSDLRFSIANEPDLGAGVAIVDGRYILIEPERDWRGVTDVLIQVADAGGLTDEQAFRVTVDGEGDPVVRVAISGNQYCPRRVSGVRRCYHIESHTPLPVALRFYFRRVEQNGHSLEDLRAYHYESEWNQVVSPYEQGALHPDNGLYIEARHAGTFSPFALDHSGALGGAIYLPLALQSYP